MKLLHLLPALALTTALACAEEKPKTEKKEPAVEAKTEPTSKVPKTIDGEALTDSEKEVVRQHRDKLLQRERAALGLSAVLISEVLKIGHANPKAGTGDVRQRREIKKERSSLSSQLADIRESNAQIERRCAALRSQVAVIRRMPQRTSAERHSKRKEVERQKAAVETIRNDNDAALAKGQVAQAEMERTGDGEDQKEDLKSNLSELKAREKEIAELKQALNLVSGE